MEFNVKILPRDYSVLSMKNECLGSEHCLSSLILHSCKFDVLSLKNLETVLSKTYNFST